MFKIILAALLLSGFCFADIIQDDIVIKDHKEYDLKEVCNFFYHQDYPIIEIKTATKLDCMKGVVSVTTFCKQKQSDDPFLARGYIDRNKKKAVCQSARRVMFKYSCEKDGSQKCEDSSIGCYIFRDILAVRLKIVHHSFITDEKGRKVLTCYFQTRDLENLDINEKK